MPELQPGFNQNETLMWELRANLATELLWAKTEHQLQMDPSQNTRLSYEM